MVAPAYHEDIAWNVEALPANAHAFPVRERLHAVAPDHEGHGLAGLQAQVCQARRSPTHLRRQPYQSGVKGTRTKETAALIAPVPDCEAKYLLTTVIPNLYRLTVGG
jgi:hypothetical protein